MEKKQITISIGGLLLGFRFRNRKLINCLVSRYTGYCKKNSSCDVTFQCFFSEKKLAPYQQVRYSIGANGLHHARRYDFDAKWNGDRGEMVLWPSLYSFDACLRVVLATLITEKNGLLLHASAVVRGNSAFVFIGRSGSGKTTIARLSGAKKILSDEIVALRYCPKKAVRVYATPFWGEMGKGPYCPQSYAIRSLFFLKKSRTLHTRSIGRDNAVRVLLRCVCLFGKESGHLQICLDTCLKTVSMIDCKELYFPKKPIDWGKLGL
jgi:hypothetical protein